MRLVRRFHSEAELELEAAVDWYDVQQPGLGDDFLQSVEESLEFVLEWPSIAPVVSGWDQEPEVRTQSVARFPYQVHFFLINHELIIVAIAHHRRRPNYWKGRV